jgi:hypothetical protein
MFLKIYPQNRKADISHQKIPGESVAADGDGQLFAAPAAYFTAVC